MKKPIFYQLLPIATILVGLAGCQICPNYYLLDRDADGQNESCVRQGVRRETPISHTGYHGAHGCAYVASMEACLLAKNAEDMTDEEISEASDYPRYEGNGYSDGQWYAEHPEEVAAQQYFDCEDGTGFILDDVGDLIQVKLHFFEGKDGKVYIYDDEKDEIVEFDIHGRPLHG